MVSDLHLHSIASDGELDPVALLSHAAKWGVSTLSIADHDTLAAYRWGNGAVFEEAERLGLELVVGIELDVLLEGREVHLLGYGVGAQTPTLAAHLSSVREARHERARRELTIVHERFGVGALGEAEVFAPGRDIPMRPHFIRALLAAGRFASYREGQDWFHENGARGAVPKPEIGRAVSLVHEAGGWAVLAHPGYYWKQGLPILERLEELRRGGLDGVEVEYPYASSSPELFADDETERFLTDLRARADALGLRQTRGSDCHSAGDFDRVYGHRRAHAR
jgi:predicted metal-dependent phosphoesterase TrpH